MRGVEWEGPTLEGVLFIPDRNFQELRVMEDWGLYALRPVRGEFVAHLSEEGTWHLHQVAPEVTGRWYFLQGVQIMQPVTVEAAAEGLLWAVATPWEINDLDYMGSTLAPAPK